ncbi:hypothetical protein BB558_001908 [Smittium angustum]|uniref:Uncharacterized protein n=1 Tax=Smittium angustum TaxID=133377 RepID=A0A2U1JAA7_SMIAN|nr:hypothetical protein BB558_001908 [Smittium angustum]
MDIKLCTRASNNLKIIVNLALKKLTGSSVWAMVYAFLHASGLNVFNGYVLYSEKVYKDNNRIKPNRTIEIRHISAEEKNVILFELKGQKFDESKFCEHEKEIADYMKTQPFPNGALVYPDMSYFYELSDEGVPTRSSGDLFKFNNLDQLESVINRIARTRFDFDLSENKN